MKLQIHLSLIPLSWGEMHSYQQKKLTRARPVGDGNFHHVKGNPNMGDQNQG